MLVRLINWLGRTALYFTETVGCFTIFLGSTLQALVTTRLKFKQLITQMDRIGVGSFPIVFLTGSFTGAVLFALQSYIGFKRFGAEQFIGPVVALSMIRELGPVLTGLMVTGRSGSSMAAEIGTMRITEQIDALQTLLINRYQYLIVPRIVASVIIMPLLTVFSMAFGIIGGYLVGVHVLS